jgi:large subunit ribosomal protein L23Ae
MTAKKARAAAAESKSPKKHGMKKIRTKVHFYKPKTLKLPSKPEFPKRAVEKIPVLNSRNILRFPITTEAAMKKIEEQNTIVFVVDRRANKKQIAQSFKTVYKVDALKVRTLIRYFLQSTVRSGSAVGCYRVFARFT